MKVVVMPYVLRVARLDDEESAPCVFPAGSSLLEANAAALQYLNEREARGFTYAPVQERVWYAWGCIGQRSVHLEVRILADGEYVN